MLFTSTRTDETLTSNSVNNEKLREVPYRLTYWNTVLGIISFFISLLIGFWGLRLTYQANNNTESIRKLDSLIWKQDTLITYLDAQNRDTKKQIVSLDALVRAARVQDSISKNQLKDIEGVLSNTNRTNSIGIKQSRHLQNVLESLQGSFTLQQVNQKSEMRRNYFALYKAIKLMPYFEPDEWGSYTSLFHEGTQAVFLPMIEKIKTILETGLENPYLTYDTLARRKWYNVLNDSDSLVYFLNFKIEKYNGPNLDFSGWRYGGLFRGYVKFQRNYSDLRGYFRSIL